MGSKSNHGSLLSIPKTVGEFRVIKEIGRGSFGRVYLGMHLANDAYVAIKEALPNSTKKSYRNQDFLKNEASLLKQLKHLNVL